MDVAKIDNRIQKVNVSMISIRNDIAEHYLYLKERAKINPELIGVIKEYQKYICDYVVSYKKQIKATEKLLEYFDKQLKNNSLSKKEKETIKIQKQRSKKILKKVTRDMSIFDKCYK